MEEKQKCEPTLLVAPWQRFCQQIQHKSTHQQSCPKSTPTEKL